jgi:hypothetical protein
VSDQVLLVGLILFVILAWSVLIGCICAALRGQIRENPTRSALAPLPRRHIFGEAR